MERAEREGFTPPSWRFRIARLGPVNSGDIEIKPLTLLGGPNNTGKTWVMFALYGFFKLPVPSLSVLPGLDDVVDALATQETYLWDFRAWLNQYGKKVIDFIHEGTARRLPEVFNAPQEIFSDSRLDWRLEPATLLDHGIARALEYRSGSARQVHTGFYIHKPAGDSTIQIRFSDKFPNLKLFLSGTLFSHFLGGLQAGQAFLMPAERNGLHLFFRELRERRGAVVQSVMASADSRPDANLSCYAEPIADYIDRLNLLRMRHRAKGPFHALAERVRELAGCRYYIDDDGNIGFIPGCSATDGDEFPMDLHLASSTANSLFGLWFYLEFQAKPGDVLLIDQPELYLHRAHRRAMARLLVRLSQAGLRVVCSTQSDGLVRELNSLTTANYLAAEQMAAYRFDRNHIEALPVTELL